MRRQVMLLALVLISTASVFGGIERGNRLYRAGDYAEAAEAYRAALGTRADGAELRYNLGTTLLRLGRYQEAEEYLRSALDTMEPDTRGRVQYNLGQRFLEDARAQDDPEAAAALYDAAVEAYRQALRLNPEDGHAKWNYELALRERDDQPPAGSGDDEDDEDRDDDPAEGGEGSGSGAPGRTQPRPGADSGGHDPMSREQAERILSAMEEDERQLFQDRLRQGGQERRPERDW
jgi:Ca-activated chloride channel homolog